MYSRIHREEVAKCISHLENLGHGFKPDKTEPLRRVPEGYELVVDVSTSDESEGLTWGYYYVSHATHSIFWVGAKDLHPEFAEHLSRSESDMHQSMSNADHAMRGKLSPDHICTSS